MLNQNTFFGPYFTKHYIYFDILMFNFTNLSKNVTSKNIIQINRNAKELAAPPGRTSFWPYRQRPIP